MYLRAYLLLAASAISLTAGNAFAATAEATASSDSNAQVGELVVTGSRAAPRSRLDTISPVDSIGGQVLQHQGSSNELAQALSNLTPSIDFPRPSLTDGTDHVRPATLRGLDPDQTLVLVNGVRGHVSALVNVNGSIGRGSTAFDLNTVPTAALENVEILRDGASAQYGSDAIAGVINLRLRGQDHGGGASINFGGYNTDFTTSRGAHHAGDGLGFSVSGWQGLPFGPGGFLTVSAEYVNRNPTNRSDYANPTALPLYPANTVLGRYGDPAYKSETLYLNWSTPLGANWAWYGDAGYQHRATNSAATARAYNNSNNIPSVYPLGFLPKIATKINDYNATTGVKGEVSGFKIDLSTSYGENDLRYDTVDSINASYGAASQHDFYAGSLYYNQWLIDLNVTKPVEVGLVEPLNVAFGAEYRREGFRIKAGEPASYSSGGDTSKAPVSQGFPGFRPDNEVNVNRHNWSGYIDLEGKLTHQISFDFAGRYEDYSDFGSQATGKASARWDFAEGFALRGAISSGFRAPALQQQYFTYTSTNNTVLNGQPVLIEVGTFPVSSTIAKSLGAKPLQPETSMNYSVGGVFHSGPFELTVDGYWIDMSNRIVLSETLPNSGTSVAQTAALQAILAPYNVSGARFFINGVNTTTKGVDIVARYKWDTGSFGRFDFTGAANFNKTHVTKVPAPVVSGLPEPIVAFDRGNRLTFEQGTPERKLVGTVDWSMNKFGGTLRVTNYDSVLVPSNNPTLDYSTGDATLVDLEARYKLPIPGAEAAIGVNNLFDKYPNFTPGVLNTSTGSVGFPSYSPFGFNGRYIYGRLSVNW
jgi:iron complex outermembrane recepter protein